MYEILDKINSPEDLRKLTIGELPALCNEIRSYMVECCSRNPGHLASSLGAVEMIVGLHYVFNTPEDKIVFDVGHQAYAHKILTGRRDAFKSARTKGGISGFPEMDESIYDSFGVGHSSTSISAALGMAEAERLQGRHRKVVALIGDGALTGGLAFEGLNNAGNSRSDLPSFTSASNTVLCSAGVKKDEATAEFSPRADNSAALKISSRLSSSVKVFFPVPVFFTVLPRYCGSFNSIFAEVVFYNGLLNCLRCGCSLLRCELCIANVYVGRSDNVSIGCDLLQRSVDGISNAGQKVDKTASGFLIGVLKVENNGSSGEKMICDLSNAVEGLGLNDLHLQSASGRTGNADAGSAVRSTCGYSGLGVCGIVIRAEVFGIVSVVSVVFVVNVVFRTVHSSLDVVNNTHFLFPPNYLP